MHHEHTHQHIRVAASHIHYVPLSQAGFLRKAEQKFANFSNQTAALAIFFRTHIHTIAHDTG